MVNLFYLLASGLFILCLMRLSHPRTAVQGNMLGALGMLIAIVATLLYADIVDWKWIIAGLILGSIIGALLAIRVQMTAMPQMVALLNGFGGGASVCVAGAELLTVIAVPDRFVSLQFLIATSAAGLIGAVTFWGSLVAYDKLQGVITKGQAIHFPAQSVINALVAVAALAMMIAMAVDFEHAAVYFWTLVVIASVLGVLLTIPIGGADMPVVIALLNSYSGLAGAATGFVINNNVLIIAGSLVGASGIILTKIMCKAMNRSLLNVLFARLGPTSTTASADEVYGGRVKSASAEEIAMLFDSARRVVIVPGYGMAVSQAQHTVRDLMNILEDKGIEVEFGIHPVAGRMPGHMNVLLAEADIPYEKLHEMDEINPSFPLTDVVIVIGANDVVNPLARTDPQSPIAGMPILDVDKARTVVVVKRSLSPGFAGIPNPLFAADNTLMFFNDGKKAIQELIAAVKEG